eukprot:1156365-Pelagomonas_calceolata.AAC.8
MLGQRVVCALSEGEVERVGRMGTASCNGAKTKWSPVNGLLLLGMCGNLPGFDHAMQLVKVKESTSVTQWKRVHVGALLQLYEFHVKFGCRLQLLSGRAAGAAKAACN